MNDQEFEKLQNDIETAMDHLDSLQRKYQEQTGRTYVRPIRLLCRDRDK